MIRPLTPDVPASLHRCPVHPHEGFIGADEHTDSFFDAGDSSIIRNDELMWDTRQRRLRVQYECGIAVQVWWPVQRNPQHPNREWDAP